VNQFSTRMMLSAIIGSALTFATSVPLSAAPETLTGEVISLSCYMNDKTNIGRKGATCALATVKWEGNPAGLLTADGKVYQISGGLAANNNEKLWSILGHSVSITGEVTSAPGQMPTLTAADAKDLGPPK
jgi:hypothetical protein